MAYLLGATTSVGKAATRTTVKIAGTTARATKNVT